VSDVPPSRRQRWRVEWDGGSVLLGLIVGTGLLGLVVWGLLGSGLPEANTVVTVAGVVYVFAAIGLTVSSKTTRFGAGLLLAIGVWLLVGAGVCFAFAAGGRR
jgi:hypothetical protein